MRTCRHCGDIYELSDFYKKERGRDGVRVECKNCSRAYSKQRYLELPREVKRARVVKSNEFNRANPQKVREFQIWTKYKIRPAEYEALLANQVGVCAICGVTPEESKTFHIDHDRTCCSGRNSCGKCVRGILCASCNVGLGMFKNSILFMEKAIKYLSKP